MNVLLNNNCSCNIWHMKESFLASHVHLHPSFSACMDREHQVRASPNPQSTGLPKNDSNNIQVCPSPCVLNFFFIPHIPVPRSAPFPKTHPYLWPLRPACIRECQVKTTPNPRGLACQSPAIQKWPGLPRATCVPFPQHTAVCHTPVSRPVSFPGTHPNVRH